MQQNGENLTAQKNKSNKTKSIERFAEYAVVGQKLGMNRGAGGDGDIIQVQGGHIIRATGRKDRHSKVYTAKGPRDRRVRLSAHTAIQFYDVQDRLGYDRPSKAVDWLMKNAKAAIDKLADSPNNNEERDQSATETNPVSKPSQELEQQQESSSARYAYQLQRHLGGDPRANSSVMQTPTGAESIGDSMRSFFPLSSEASLMEMQSYPHDRISRMAIQSEDLGLSLHTHQNLNHRSYTNHELLLPGPSSVGFEQNYTKPESWNNLVGEGESRVGFILNSHAIPPQLFGSQNSAAFSQRESLQSNNYSHLLHSWSERMLPSVDQQNTQQPVHPSSMYNFYFGSNFQVPPRIHGEEDHSPSSQM